MPIPPRRRRDLPLRSAVRVLALGSTLAALVGWASPASALIIDFESLSEGTVVDNSDLPAGFTISVANGRPSHPDAAIIFDSACSDGCSGDDPDLKTPGQGTGNDTAQGHVLIIAENLIDNSPNNDLVDNPDDEGSGGTIVLTFPQALPVESLRVVDIDVNETTGFVSLALAAGGTLQIPLDDLGNNSAQTITFAGSPLATSMTVFFQGSGSIDDIVLGEPADCGDGTMQPPEECDGPDDEACPGECESDCTCSPSSSTTTSSTLPGGSTTTVPGGGSTTTVPGGGSTTTVPGGGSTTTVPGGGSTTTVPGGGSTTTVPGGGGGSTTTVPGGGSTTTVPGGGSTTTVPGGGSTTTVPGGGSTTTVPGGGSTTTIPGGSTTTTVPGGGGGSTTTVPGGGSTTTVPGGGSTTTIPGGSTTTTVPGGGSTTTVPGGGSTTTVPGGGGGSTTTVPGGGSTTTIPGGGSTTTIPSGGGFCGDGVVQPPEECDDNGENSDSEPNACRTNCKLPFCGDGVLDKGEFCEPTLTAGCTDCTVGECPTQQEVCNNDFDDDGDLLIDCFDEECERNVRPPCGCEGLLRDPGIIRFDTKYGADFFSLHGSFRVHSAVDYENDRFTVELKNELGTIWRGTLVSGELTRRQGGKGRYWFLDREAREGGPGDSDNIYRVGLRTRVRHGQAYVHFRIRSYGDFSLASEPEMSLQLAIGDDVAATTQTWKRTPWGWVLYLKDFSE